jgi:hypothetical protein
MQHDPRRLPGESEQNYWARFSRLNRERIEALEKDPNAIPSAEWTEDVDEAELPDPTL